MTTLVGTQNDFYDALYALCELDYDAVEAYKAAINRVENTVYKQQLTEFMHDHKRHIQEISSVLRKHQQEIPDGPDMKQYLTQGKRWSRYLVIDFSHPWPKSTRQRAKCLAPTVLRPARCPERASVCLPQ